MRTRQTVRLRLEELEPKVAPTATWIVIPPGTGVRVVEQYVPQAAVLGLENASARANAAQGANCWIVIDHTGPS